jgi:hypothetical protein
MEGGEPKQAKGGRNMTRKDWLTMCTVALTVAGITIAVFSPQPVCAKGPAEGSQPKLTTATVNYQGCKVSIKMGNAVNPNGKLSLECENPTSNMVDFPATLTWTTQDLKEEYSRVLRPASKAIETRSLRCIAFPHSTASFDIALPKNPGSPMLNLNIRMGDVEMQFPLIIFAASLAQDRQQSITNVAVNRR